MSILLNDSELAAMRGLPHSAFCLYVAIRQIMDLATGMVGIRVYTSWQALGESLHVEPEAGRVNSGSPSKSAVRRLGECLERAGLVKISSNSSNRQLIFKCLLATHDKSAKNKPDTHPDTQPDTPKRRKSAANTASYKQTSKQPDTHPDIEPDIHPSLDIYSVVKSSSSYGEAVQNTQDDDNQPIGLETPLIYPPRTEDWQGRMQTMLRGLSHDDAQTLLDELAGQMRTGKVTKPLGYLARMIENYLRGDFRGELGSGEKAIRERRENERQQREAEACKPVFQKNPAAFSQALGQLEQLGILKRRKAEA